ncbi:MAG: molybdate ABC transporter permease subunit [Candidatus Puniceispirillales bacterium]|jgi:molybdate transport system permease protein|nr:molybdate ABC transporter permease subunit [Alphaproteobacteria bacterium]MBL6850976.1 molybdate ABC transporter permease subunit [Alphaproteobacteria bacterium]MDA0916226.1 molybdate ABC transporter permease subunit [Pseudomonadota bacterium]
MEIYNLFSSDISAIFISLKLALITCFFLGLIGTPLAYYLAFKSKASKSFLEAVVTLPLVLPPTVIGFYLIIIFSPDTYLGNFFIMLTGEQLIFSFYGLVLASVIYSLPFWVQPLQSSFERIGKDTIKTANTLGANSLDTFKNVIIPLSKRGFLTSFIISFAHTMGEFGIVLMVGGGIHGKTKVIAISIYDHVEQLSFGKAHFLAAGMLILSFIILICLFYSNRKSVVRIK